MSKFIDVRGVDGKPLLGRLRGVTARHEIRQVVVENEPNEFKANDAHFAFCGAVPQPLPDLLSNGERQLVVSGALGAALVRLDPKIELLPVRLVDDAGKVVAPDGGYAVAIVKVIAKAVDAWSKGSIGGYLFNEIKDAPEPAEPMPPLFRVAHSLAIGCNDDAAAVLQNFSGVVLTAFPDYVDVLVPPPAPYLLWQCGTDGASFSIAGSFGSALEAATLDPSTWPRGGPVATMKPPKSRKKLVDFMSGSGAPIVSARAKAALEKQGVVDVDFLPVQAQDHDGKPVKGEHWVMFVRCTRPLIDVAESDIEVVDELLWTAREIVVDDATLVDRPPLFRGAAGARYPWVFLRSDVAEALEKAKLTGFRTQHPADFTHSVEGGGLPRIC